MTLLTLTSDAELKTSPIDSISKLDKEADFDEEEIYSERIIEEKDPRFRQTPLLNDPAGKSRADAVAGRTNEHATAGVPAKHVKTKNGSLEMIKEAKMKGYTGDICQSCGSLTMVRNGTCLKCTTCGDTSGCS